MRHTVASSWLASAFFSVTLWVEGAGGEIHELFHVMASVNSGVGGVGNMEIPQSRVLSGL